MRKAHCLFTICAALALFSRFAQARPGRGIFIEVSNRRTLLNFSSDDPQLPETEITKFSVDGKTEATVLEHQKVNEAVQLKPKGTQAESEKTKEAEEDEVVCTEMGTCYEKRLLTATIDYKNDGPNNPITDPPH